MDKSDKGQVSKREQIEEFMSILDDHISNKITDSTADCNDSCAGYSAYGTSGELEKALYKLFDIEVE
jgi:hypothetical protein